MTGDLYSKGGDAFMQFEHDPVKSFELYGYTEYIELKFKYSIYVREIQIGYPRGFIPPPHTQMCANHILL